MPRKNTGLTLCGWCLVGPEGFRLSSLTFDPLEKDIQHVEGYRVAPVRLIEATSDNPRPPRRAGGRK